MSEINGGAPVEGTPTSTPAPEAAPAAQSDPFAPVLSRVDELASNIDSRFAAFEQRLPQPEPVAEPDPWADLFGTQEEEPDPYGQPQQPQGLDPQALQSAIQAAIAQSNAPLQQQLQQFQIERNAQILGEKVPALADRPENRENRQQAFQLVSQALQNYPEAIANQLMADPNFIAVQWEAAEARRNAQGQAPAGAPPSLETAGGALPGGPSEPMNPVHQAYGNQQTLPKGFA